MFKLLKTENRARRGEFTTVHGTIQTPVFMNVGTCSTIKGGISSMDLVEKIPGAIYCRTLPEVTECLRGLAQPGDVILTMGAGDIYRAGEALLK